MKMPKKTTLLGQFLHAIAVLAKKRKDYDEALNEYQRIAAEIAWYPNEGKEADDESLLVQ